MNRIHRTVWNPHRQAFVAVAETARSRGKASGVSGALLAGVLLAGPAVADSASKVAAVLPGGAHVTAGQAKIDRSGSTLTVEQGSARAAIEWTSFSIGKDATVRFVQPNAGAVALNRVTGSEGSVIDGALKANGQVFILNPNGVLFGAGARVDTAGLLATTLKLSDADFMAGKTTFSAAAGKGAAGVVNQGSLTAADGGYVVLMGQQVRNDGVISARLGTVALAAGDKVSLNFNGDSLVGVAVDAGALDALVANGHAIRADGGLVLLTAKGADGLLNTLVNNSGEIRARTVENRAGRIYLLGEGGAVEVAGTLDASAPGGGAGGFVETSGKAMRVQDGTVVTTKAAAGTSGTWLIDPTDFSIAAGTATQSASGIGATTLQTALAAGNVTIQTQATGTEAGHINVNAPVAWSANLLTLEAHGDINVNAVMSATGSSTLNLKTGYNFNTGSPAYDAANSVRMAIDLAANGTPSFSGRIDFADTTGGVTTPRTGTGVLSINGSGYTLIGALGAAGAQTSAGNFNLQGLAHSSNAAGRFALAYDINAAATSGWNAGAGFVPIGNNTTAFSGSFQGLGHAVSGLAINRGGNEAIGLFGRVANGSSVASGTVVQGVGLTNANVSGNAAGTLVGRLGAATVRNSWASGGSVAGDGRLGGLIGWSEGSVIANVAARVAVNLGNDNGNAPYNGINGEAGGLVGLADTGTSVTNAMAAGAIDLGSDSLGAGGAFGHIAGGSSVSRTYSLGNVTARGGSMSFGGFVGVADNSTITDAYSRGTVAVTASFQSNLGGFAGETNNSTINRVYAAAPVSGSFVFGGQGGLIGQQSGGSVTNSFWDDSIAGNGNANGVGTARSTAQMNDTSTFTAAGWNFQLGNGVWARRDDVNNKYPVLRAFGYAERIGIANLDSSFLGDPNAALSYTTSNLLSGDVLTLTQSGSTLSTAFNNPARAGFYDAFQVRGQATTGNLTVNRSFGWTNFKLTLEAAGDINVNAVMSATGTSQLDLKAGYNFNVGSPAYDAAKTVRMGIAVAQNGTPSFNGRVDFVTTAGGNTGRSGNGALTVNGQDYTLVNALGSAADASSSGSATLQRLAHSSNLAGRFALAVDIDASATSGWNSGSGFRPIGTPAGSTLAPFTGTLDGLGHTVSNLTVHARTSTPFLDGTGLDFGGLVADASGARLRNIGLGDVAVQVNNEAGALLGRGQATIDNAWATGSVISNYRVGGLAGHLLDGSSVQNAQAKVDVFGWNTIDYSDPQAIGPLDPRIGGGLIGEMGNGRIVDSAARGAVNMRWNGANGEAAGGLVGVATVSGSGSFTLQNSNAWGLVQASGGGVGGLLGAAGDLRTGASSVGILVQQSNAHGDVISAGGWYAGGLIGQIGSSATALDRIVDSHAYGQVQGGNYTGGLVGSASNVSIESTSAAGAVSGFAYTGGLVGQFVSGSISGSTASGATVSGHQFTGGFLGSAGAVSQTTQIAGSSTTVASVSAPNDDDVGGFVGLATAATLGNVSATGSVSGLNNIGGLAGRLVTSSVSTSSAGGTTSGIDAVGGLVGRAQAGSSVDASVATGAVTGTGSGTGVGGLVGVMYTLQSGNTTGNSVTASRASGNVSGVENVGGLIGDSPYSGSTVQRSYASGSVTATRFAGGFLGSGNASVTDAYATGSVTATDGSNGYAGGFAGGGFGTLTLNRVYSSGVVTAADLGSQYGSGGLAGFGMYTVNNSFYDATRNPNGAATGYGTAKTTAQMKDVSTFTAAGWDFTFGTGTWGRKDSLNTGYPVLRAFGYTDPLSLALAGAGKTYGDANPSLGAFTVTGCPTANCITAVSLGSAIGLTTGVGSYAYSGANVLSLTFANGYNAGQFELAVPGSFTIAPRVLTVAAANGASRVYDASTQVAASLLALSNVVNGDTVTLTGNATLAAADVGSRAIAATSGLSQGNPNYTLNGAATSGSVAITPATLSVAATSGATRVYDRTTAADAGLFQASGLLGSDTTTLSGSALLASANAGTQAVAGLGTLAAGNGNYVLANAVPGGSVEVSPRPVTIVSVTGATRTYDKTDLAGNNLLSFGNVVNGDSVALASGGVVIQDRNVGQQAFTGALRNATLTDANYTLAGAVPSGSLLVTPKPMTAIWALANSSREYDGTTDAPAALLFPILYNGDTTHLSGSGVLSGANAGVRTLVGVGTLTQDNPNYVITSATATSRPITITPRAATVDTVAGASRVYDGSTVAAAGLLRITNAVAGDNVGLTGSGVLAGRDVGNQAVALGSLALANNANGNYVLASTPPGGTVAVTALPVSLSAIAGASRVYDGSTDAAAGLLQLGNVLSGDTVHLAGSAALAGRDVGTQAIAIGGLTLDNANYTLSGVVPAGTVGITARPVSVAAAAGASRVYDGSTAAAAGLLQLGNVVAGDSVALAGSATLAGRDVGAQAVSLGSLTLNNGNYTLVGTTPSGTVTITARPVGMAAVGGASRAYDGTADAAAGLLEITNVVAGDSVALTGSARLAGRDVGAQAVGLGSLTLTNGNYTLTGTTPGGSVTITARPVGLSAVAGASRPYDATTTASAGLLQVTGVVAGDSVQLDGTATLASRHVGAQAVGVGSLTLSNGNYTLAGVTPGGTVTITARPAGVAAVDGASRVYDGGTAAPAALLRLTGVVAGDSVNLGGSATLAGRDVGAQAVARGGLTLDNADYTLAGATPVGSVAITARPVTLAAVNGASKVYDGSTAAPASLLQVGNVVAGDSVALSGTATLAGKAVGTQTLAAGTLALSNGNYTLAGVAPSGSVAITPRTLNLVFTVADKVFDGSATAAVSATDNRLAGDALRVEVGTAAFADAEVGRAKPVTISGVGLAGADAGNYRVAGGAAATASGNLLARSVTYSLAPQDPAKTYTASGQMLVSAAELDKLVAASFANTVAGTAPGALSYTLWRDGQQVDGLKEAGVYEVRASFAAADAHYALAESGNTVLTLSVAQASNSLQETIAQAVRTEVPGSATAAVYAGVSAPRPLAEFNPAPPNVAVAPPSITSTFGEGTALSLVSSPSEREPSEGVSLTQARRMVKAANGASAESANREVRVPVSRNSLAEIVNGGVKLPGGVDQLLFVVKAGQ